VRVVAACLIALAFGFFGSMPLAGPISVMVVSRAARRRFDEAWHVALGAAAAEAFYAGFAFWGYTTLFARHPLLAPVSQAVSAVVLLVVGAGFAVWSPKDKSDVRENRAGTVLLGLTVSALNPTLLVTWTAAVAFVYSKGLRGIPSFAAVPFGACAGAGVAAWNFVLVRLLRKYEGKAPRAVVTWAVRLLGFVLVGLGLWSGAQLYEWLRH
jgi:threonine/homoserine/homoserine lactone efflux protein